MKRLLDLNKYFAIVIILFLYINLSAQSLVELPQKITLIIDDKKFDYNESWLDSLANEAINQRFCFKIAGVSSTKRFTTSHIQLPQILSLREIYRQIILYYALIPAENLRKKEKVLVFPYFKSRHGDPSLIARYKEEGTFEIEVLNWGQVPVPTVPGHRDMRVFNQVLHISFKDIQSFSDLSEDIFEEVAILNHLTNRQVMNIYKNTTLWQYSRYFCHGDTLPNPQ